MPAIGGIRWFQGTGDVPISIVVVMKINSMSKCLPKREKRCLTRIRTILRNCRSDGQVARVRQLIDEQRLETRTKCKH